MVLSRQTGIEEKLGTPSLRQHAMPSPLHPPLALLLLSSIFPSFVSNLTIPAPHCPRDFLLLSLTPHLIFTSHPTLPPPRPAQPLPLPPVSPYLPTSFLLIQTGLAVCCPTIRPEPKQHSPTPPPPPP